MTDLTDGKDLLCAAEEWAGSTVAEDLDHVHWADTRQAGIHQDGILPMAGEAHQAEALLAIAVEALAAVPGLIPEADLAPHCLHHAGDAHLGHPRQVQGPHTGADPLSKEAGLSSAELGAPHPPAAATAAMAATPLTAAAAAVKAAEGHLPMLRHQAPRVQELLLQLQLMRCVLSWQGQSAGKLRCLHAWQHWKQSSSQALQALGRCKLLCRN